MYVKPSGVFFIALDFARSLESAFRPPTLSRRNPACGRDVTNPTTAGSVPASVIGGAAITVSHKNAWAILQSEDALGRRHIFFKRCLRLLDDTYLVTILDQNVVNAFQPDPSAQAP